MSEQPRAQANNKLVSAKECELIHRNSDRDGRRESLHHTLGAGPAQASPGDHAHDGGTSRKLLDGVSITGSRTSGTAVLSIVQALEKLGATDSTTA